MEKHTLGKVAYNEPIIEKAEIFLRSKDLSKPGAAVDIMAKLIYLDYTNLLWQRGLVYPRRQLTVKVDLDNGLLKHRNGVPKFANLAWFLEAVRRFVVASFP